MAVIDLHQLLGRLAPELSSALERAAALAVRNGHSVVGIGHFLNILAHDAAPAALIEDCGGAPGTVISQTDAAWGKWPATDRARRPCRAG